MLFKEREMKRFFLQTVDTVTEKRVEMIRIFKVHHTDEQIEEEMNSIVDLGGRIVGCICLSQDLWCDSCTDGNSFQKRCKRISDDTGKRKFYALKTYYQRLSLFKNTVATGSKETLDFIQDTLKEKGFLAELRDFEPVEFPQNGQDAL
ncbi:MAG: 3H domain-containing protein [Lachnospiraceae bacterium]